MKKELEDIYDNFKLLINKLKIFKNVDSIYNEKHKQNAIISILINIKKRNTLEKIPNVLFSGDPQYNNIAGFEAVYNNAGQIHSPYKVSNTPDIFRTIYDKLGNNEIETRNNWHYDMLYVIYNVFHKVKINTIKQPDTIITTMNEEWHYYNVNGPNNEFITLKKDNNLKSSKKKQKSYKTKYPIQFLGNTIKPITNNGNECEESGMKHIIKHRLFYIGNNIILINIHSASNIDSSQISKEIIKLLNSIKNNKNYKKYDIILGGDSNVYYGDINKTDGISNINNFRKLVSKINYKLLISRHIVAKYRPYNFFQNAQSSTKGGDWTNEETMIIIYPSHLNISYDKKHYIELFNKDLKITDFYKQYRYGFLGTKYKNMNREKHVNSINNKNWYNNLYSDHVPIYCNLHKDNKIIRIIFTNNLSINSNRGVNNNSSKFKIKDIKKLEELSKNEIVNFFIKESEKLLQDELDKIKKSENNLDYLKKLLKYQLPKKYNTTNIKIKIPKPKSKTKSKAFSSKLKKHFLLN